MPAAFRDYLGMEVLSVGENTATLRLKDRPELHNGRGHIHGGAIAALVDMAVGNACRSPPEEDRPTATMSLTVTYLEPAAGDLVAIATVLRRGGGSAAAEARVTLQDGRLVAHAVGTVRRLSAGR
jgi:uncharacterized protein (TIGR00369 family)